jgi:DNA-3-methyladenine glycosylase II
MKQSILSHFRKNDPRIAVLLETIPLENITPRRPQDFFVSLASEIIGQQLSGTVADVIEGRFRKLFGRKNITPSAVLTIPDETLRKTGMSWSKVKFIKDLAGKVEKKEVDLPRLVTLDDAAVIVELTKIKGIGPWTAEMFLMFTLGREDVFSFGDLGLRQGIQKVYNLREEPSRKRMETITKRWSPYRTYAARLLWRYKDGE